MRPTRARLAVAAITCGLATMMAGAAWAQQAGDGTPAPQRDSAHRPWGDEGQMKARMEGRRDRRLQVLHDALGLRSDQETAWQAFVADSRTARDDRERGRPTGSQAEEARAPLTTPERLDRMSQRLAALQARLARRAVAVKRFYADLDARQQKTFDALFAMGARGFGRDGRPGGPDRLG
jgi:hypothetical protein